MYQMNNFQELFHLVQDKSSNFVLVVQGAVSQPPGRLKEGSGGGAPQKEGRGGALSPGSGEPYVRNASIAV